MADDIYNEPVSDSEAILRKKVRERLILGGLMCSAGPLLLVMIFLTSYAIPSGADLFLVIALVAIGIAGIVMVGYYGMGSSLLFRSMDILRKLAPPDPVIVGKYVVINKDPVFGVGQWGSNILFFVAFRESERSFEEKTKLPGLIWKWEYKHRIGAVKVAKREDEFTIPIGDGTYRKGRGLLYGLLLERQVIVSYYRDFTLEELSPVIEELAREVGSLEFSSDFEDTDEAWD